MTRNVTRIALLHPPAWRAKRRWQREHGFPPMRWNERFSRTSISSGRGVSDLRARGAFYLGAVRRCHQYGGWRTAVAYAVHHWRFWHGACGDTSRYVHIGTQQPGSSK